MSYQANWFLFFLVMLATQGTIWPPQLILNMLCIQRLGFQCLKKCEVFVEILECLRMSLIPQKKGNRANHVLANVMWGEDVEATAVSTKASLSPHRGQAFPGQFLCSALSRSRAGQEISYGRGFSHGSEMNSLPWGIPLQQGRAPWKQRTGSTASSPSTDISQRKHTGEGVQEIIDIFRASPHWNKQYRPTLCLWLFFGCWLSFPESRKCQGLYHALISGLFLKHLKTIQQTP